MAQHDVHNATFPTLDQGWIAILVRCAGASLKQYRGNPTSRPASVPSRSSSSSYWPRDARFERCGSTVLPLPTKRRGVAARTWWWLVGGNYGGKAVVYLAGLARKALLLIRDGHLSKSLSSLRWCLGTGRWR